MSMRMTPDEILIQSLRILARDIISSDGGANAAIAEAADRLEELTGTKEALARPATRLNTAQKQRLLKQIDVGTWKTSWHLPRQASRIDWDNEMTLVIIRDVLLEQIGDAKNTAKEAEVCLEICVWDMIILDEIKQEEQNER